MIIHHAAVAQENSAQLPRFLEARIEPRLSYHERLSCHRADVVASEMVSTYPRTADCSKQIQQAIEEVQTRLQTLRN